MMTTQKGLFFAVLLGFVLFLSQGAFAAEGGGTAVWNGGGAAKTDCKGYNDWLKALGISEGGGDYCKVGGGGNNYVGKYQFNQDTLGDNNRVPSSCYSGCRQVKSSCFRCNGNAQEQAFKCYFERNKQIIDEDIRKESGGKYKGLDDLVGKQICQQSEFYYAGCKKRLANGQAKKRSGPKCITVTRAGVYAAAHLAGPYKAGDMLVKGENSFDGFCTSSFHYMEKLGNFDVAGDGQCTTGGTGVVDSTPGDYSEDPRSPRPGDGTSGRGGRSDGLEALFDRGGSRDPSSNNVDVPNQGESIGDGSYEDDDDSAGKVIDGMEYEKELDFSKTMAWIDDFEQHRRPLGPAQCEYCLDFPSCCCDKSKMSSTAYAACRKSKPACRCELKETCSVKANYSEPTAFVEVTAEPGFSLLGDLGRYASASARSDGGAAGMRLGGSALSFYEARVFGISPEARLISSGSEESKKRSFSCDLGAWGWTHWENITVPGETTPNIDAAAGEDDAMKKAQMKGVSEAMGQWREKWFKSGSDIGKDAALIKVFTSEEQRPDWVEGEKKGRSVNANNVLCGSDKRVNTENFSAGQVERNKDCFGSWGPIEPLTGFATHASELAEKALVGARAYEIGKKRGIFPYEEQAPKRGTNVPKIEFEHTGWQYWYTDFNLEWPYHTKQRYMLGEDSFKWESMLSDNQNRSKTLQELIAQGFGKGMDNEKLKKDGLVMTLWKRTTCRIHACCDPWPKDHCWRAKDPWKILYVDEIDDWETEDASTFNPTRQ